MNLADISALDTRLRTVYGNSWSNKVVYFPFSIKTIIARCPFLCDTDTLLLEYKYFSAWIGVETIRERKSFLPLKKRALKTTSVVLHLAEISSPGSKTVVAYAHTKEFQFETGNMQLSSFLFYSMGSTYRHHFLHNRAPELPEPPLPLG